MDTGIRPEIDHLENALTAADMAWWEIEFPSGALKFSKNKTDMLGYDKADFYHYTNFTELIHPDDYQPAMDAMIRLMKNETDTYETTYRIKASDGTYKLFFDKGRIVERFAGSYTVAGIVTNVSDALKSVLLDEA